MTKDLIDVVVQALQHARKALRDGRDKASTVAELESVMQRIASGADETLVLDKWRVVGLIGAIDALRFDRWCDCVTCVDLVDMESAVDDVCAQYGVLLPERYRRPLEALRAKVLPPGTCPRCGDPLSVCPCHF